MEERKLNEERLPIAYCGRCGEWTKDTLGYPVPDYERGMPLYTKRDVEEHANARHIVLDREYVDGGFAKYDNLRAQTDPFRD